MSKKMMIFTRFPTTFLWKSLMTLMTLTFMTGEMMVSKKNKLVSAAFLH